MLQAMPEHAASICPSHAQKCYERTQRTNATDARENKQEEHVAVPYAAEAVDNPNSVASTVQQHQLIGVDAGGRLCSCGVYGGWLEHLADVALFVFGSSKPVAPPARPNCRMDGCQNVGWTAGLCTRHYREDLAARKAMTVTPDERWAEDQQRRHNLASHSRPVPVREVRRKPVKFTIEQLLIADRVAEKEAA